MGPTPGIRIRVDDQDEPREKVSGDAGNLIAGGISRPAAGCREDLTGLRHSEQEAVKLPVVQRRCAGTEGLEHLTNREAEGMEARHRDLTRRVGREDDRELRTQPGDGQVNGIDPGRLRSRELRSSRRGLRQLLGSRCSPPGPRGRPSE